MRMCTTPPQGFCCFKADGHTGAHWGVAQGDAQPDEAVFELPDGERSWSVPSAGTQLDGPPSRVILRVDPELSGLIDISECDVTSFALTARPLADGVHGRVSLTTHEARWLLTRLAAAVEYLEAADERTNAELARKRGASS